MSNTENKSESVELGEENIKDVIDQLVADGFYNETPWQKDLLRKVVIGRLKGYTKDNCPHPEMKYYGGYFEICTQCGYEKRR